MTNGSGSDASRDVEFWHFDRLPRPYRDFLNNCNLNMGCESLRRKFHRYDANEALPMARELVEQIELQTARSVWGDEHPFVVERMKKSV